MQAARDFDRIFEVFKAYKIRFFFYAGGNDSQDTGHKIHQEAVKRGWYLRVIGVPKTIDNDLPHTDHCPGYGSVIKYNATTVMEVADDDGSCCVVEVMGRAAGWIAAGTVLAKRQPDDAPHIILLPEVDFNEDAFIRKVQETVARLKYFMVVVGEGLKDETGEEIAAAHCASQQDVEEAVACGKAAVLATVQGRNGFMVKLVRTSNNPYR